MNMPMVTKDNQSFCNSVYKELCVSKKQPLLLEPFSSLPWQGLGMDHL